MRLMAVLAIGSMAISSGCRSEEALLAGARKQVGDECRASAPPGVDVERLCTCVVERTIGGRTVADLTNMPAKEAENLGLSAAGQCMAEIVPGGPQPGAAAPSAEEAGESQAEIGEATEEAVDEVE